MIITCCGSVSANPATPPSFLQRASFLQANSSTGRAVTRWATKLWEVVCDEHGIGGIGEYCGDNDSHLDRINVVHHEAFDGKFVPCVVLVDLEPGVIGAATLSRRLASSSARATS